MLQSLNSSAAEQRTENPCVGSSNLSLNNFLSNEKLNMEFIFRNSQWTNGKKKICFKKKKTCFYGFSESARMRGVFNRLLHF